MKLKDCSKSLEQTLKDSNLHNISINNVEVILDGLLEDGIAKDIPIIGSVIGVGKVAVGIRETLFLKKIIYFISELSEIPQSKRKELIEEIDDSKKYRTKIGEKLLFIIDKCDDHDTAQIIAKLFAAFLREELTYDDFLRAVSIIENVFIQDLNWFVKQDGNCFDLRDLEGIRSSGLVDLNIYDTQDLDMTQPQSYELNAYISDIGSKIRDILAPKTNAD